ncbi:helix-turn-helix domain-containing protein [Streptomyces sp. NPDC091027]|uniref:helix-turn-helix domain-containing protein n=1 Tax=Streptomyces sp. NPDC091027 TaxID=3365971 RepID=UPI00381B57DD
MHDEYNDQNAALADLRERLRAGMARMRLKPKDLVARSGLGRTTVSQALSPTASAPSRETVEALARALRLPLEELLELQRNAAGDTGGRAGSVPGRAIGEWDPHDLEVHPAGPGRSGARTMPRYVWREHDRVLAGLVEDAAAGRSRAVVLVGSSSTGKTRACWEAVQPLAAKGWQLWHPFDPTRARDALDDLPRVVPRTVVWLNEAQHYLGDRVAGERIAAAVHQLLVTAERGPVLVLGTLWPEYAARYTALPAPGQEDPHSRVREFLAGRVLTVPETFEAQALAAASAFAESGDKLLADALSRARADGRITQDLAGAPELLNRYRHATPAAAAVLEVAMDARRLGAGLHLPHSFLTEAAADYLTDTDYDHLTDDWAEQAFAELAAPVHGKQAPLRRTTPRTRRRPPAPSPALRGLGPTAAGPVFRLADYLEQHGRTSRRHLCPPASFWHAAHTHLTDPDDLRNLAREAEDRHRLQWGYHLLQQVADCGHADAVPELARMRENSGDLEGAQTLYRQAASHGNANAMLRLAEMRLEAGDQEGAETLFRKSADHGHIDALCYLAAMRELAGDLEGAADLYRQAADRGGTDGLCELARMREETGDLEGAADLYRQADDRGNADALRELVRMREISGDRQGAEALARQDGAFALSGLARVREEAGDDEGAETLYLQAADRGNVFASYEVARMRKEAGDLEGAETLFRQCADRNVNCLAALAFMREEAGDLEGAETLYRQAADIGYPIAMYRLIKLREGAGDRENAETLAQQIADRGYTYVPYDQAGMLELFSMLWPYGLDPDGTPTPPW